MKKILLSVSTLALLAASCTTVKIVAPPGRQITLASRGAKCQHVKRRKVLYWNGIPLNWTVFNELLAGVRPPVKILILNTWLDNLLSSSRNQHSHGRYGDKSNIEIKTMDVFSCVEPAGTPPAPPMEPPAAPSTANPPAAPPAPPANPETPPAEPAKDPATPPPPPPPAG